MHTVKLQIFLEIRRDRVREKFLIK